MTRFLLAALAALVAGCGAAPSGLSPDDAFQSAMTAADSGDVRRALALLDEAAEAGHVEALAVRARAYGRGYLRTDYGRGHQRGVIPSNLSLLVLPGQARAAEDDYQQALAEGARAGDEDVLFRLADKLLDRQFAEGVWREGDQDSARAVYRRLSAQGAAPLRLAFLAKRLDDDPAYDAHLDAAAAAGDPHACLFQMYRSHGQAEMFSARRVAASIDHVESCRAASPAARDSKRLAYADSTLSSLANQARRGNAEAHVVLDSLRTLGVFERHPRLAAAVGGA